MDRTRRNVIRHIGAVFGAATLPPSALAGSAFVAPLSGWHDLEAIISDIDPSSVPDTEPDLVISPPAQKNTPDLSLPEGVQCCVLDYETGFPYILHDAQKQRQPASLTKIALLLEVFAALESPLTRFRRQSPVIIPDEVANYPLDDLARGSFKPGQNYEARVLMQAAGSKSCAISTLALAYHLGEPHIFNWGGTLEQRIEKCADLMNQRAQANDLTKTRFHGIIGDADENNISTPYELSRLMHDIAYNYSNLSHLAFGDPQITLAQPWMHIKHHSSRNIYQDPRVLLAKTGWNDIAGHCESLIGLIDGRLVIVTIQGIEGQGSTPQAKRYDASMQRLELGQFLLNTTEVLIKQYEGNPSISSNIYTHAGWTPPAFGGS